MVVSYPNLPRLLCKRGFLLRQLLPQAGAVAKADFVGFNIGNDFVVGYGMDDGGRYRGLPYIGKVMS